MRASFKLLCVDNHSKDLLAKINFFGVETLAMAYNINHNI